MSNQEPAQEMLRRSAVLAWLGITRDELEKWAADGIVDVWRRPGSRWFYYKKSSIKRNVLVPGRAT